MASRFPGLRSLSLLTVLVLTLAPLRTTAAENDVRSVLASVLPGGGRVLSLTGANDPLRSTGTPISRNQIPGSDSSQVPAACFQMPAETDLRLIWMETTGAGYEITLRFFAPIQFLSTLHGHKVHHLVSLTFTSPDGETVTEAVGKSGNISLKRGNKKLDATAAAASLALTDLVFTLPTSAGVEPDWIMQARVKIEMTEDGDFCDDPRLGDSEFHIETSPVLVGSLTGEDQEGLVKALPVPMGFGQTPATDQIDYTWQTQEMPPEIQLDSVRLEHNTDGHLIAVLTMAAPMTDFNALMSSGLTFMQIGLDLVPPAFLGLKHPYQISLGGFIWPPKTAAVLAPGPNQYQNIIQIGQVPVSVEGAEIRLDLTAFTAIDPVMSGELPAGETIVGQIGDQQLRFEAVTTSEGNTDDGQSEQIVIEIDGPAVRVTFADGTTSTGWIDPYDNEFVVDGDTLAGGLGYIPNRKCLSADVQRFLDMVHETERGEYKDAKDEYVRLLVLAGLTGPTPGSQLDRALKEAEKEYEELGIIVQAQSQSNPPPTPVKVTGCEEESSPASGSRSTVRAATNHLAGPPEWVAPLPGPYWSLEELGLEPLRFGPAGRDPFPFPIVTNWIPDSWNLPPAEEGWAIRGWSTASLQDATLTPAVFTPYIAATLISPALEGSSATPVAVTPPQQAVIRSARTRRHRHLRPSRMRP